MCTTEQTYNKCARVILNFNTQLVRAADNFRSVRPQVVPSASDHPIANCALAHIKYLKSPNMIFYAHTYISVTYT